jgi:hypothetical protein
MDAGLLVPHVRPLKAQVMTMMERVDGWREHTCKQRINRVSLVRSGIYEASDVLGVQWYLAIHLVWIAAV